MERKYYKGLIRQALHEDLDSRGDITSNSIFTGKERGVFTLIAKDDGILCGLAPFAETFRQLNHKVRIEPYFNDGDRLAKGDIVARVRGKLTAILTGERTALNIISHLSGISTKASRFVAVAGTKPVVLDTRKTIPGMRRLQKYAVSTGGATSHRTGLYDMVLIKDNHIDAAGSIEKAVSRVRSKWGKRFKVEVETRNLAEVSQAIKAGADRIMLDNMSNDMMKEAVTLIGGRAETEASGNMTIDRLPSLSETGVDFVSFGELTHTVKVFDFSLKQESAE